MLLFLYKDSFVSRSQTTHNTGLQCPEDPVPVPGPFTIHNNAPEVHFNLFGRIHGCVVVDVLPEKIGLETLTYHTTCQECQLHCLFIDKDLRDEVRKVAHDFSYFHEFT
jgi:hypothetical protein